MQETCGTSSQETFDLKDVYRRYQALLEHERNEIRRESWSKTQRDELLRWYSLVPFERFEAAMCKDGWLSKYVAHLTRVEQAMQTPNRLR